MSEKTNDLIEAVRREADRAGFPVDAEIYERSGRDPKLPIFFAGSLDAPLCVVGRDLGKDEVQAFDWFGPYGEEAAFQTDGATAVRFRVASGCVL
jgi:hypothetical protein